MGLWEQSREYRDFAYKLRHTKACGSSLIIIRPLYSLQLATRPAATDMKLLQATGRDFEGTKCSFGLLFFFFKM